MFWIILQIEDLASLFLDENKEKKWVPGTLCGHKVVNNVTESKSGSK